MQKSIRQLVSEAEERDLIIEEWLAEGDYSESEFEDLQMASDAAWDEIAERRLEVLSRPFSPPQRS